MNAIRRSAAVLAAGALLALAACGGDSPAARPSAPKEPAPSIASEPSNGGGKSDGGGEPTKAAPNIPPPDPKDFPGMDQKTDKGAEQAARHYIQVLYWAHQTDGGYLLEELSEPSCKFCLTQKKNVEKIRDEGELWGRRYVDIRKCIKVLDRGDTKEHHCAADIYDGTDDGSKKLHESSTPGGQQDIAVRTSWKGGKWKVIGLVVKDREG